jgi:Tol biopolymer transport system component
MTPELHQRAGELFDRVRDMPASECAAAIQSACNGNDELRDHVLWLLSAYRASGDFLDGGAIRSAALLMNLDLPSAGAIIGNFRLIEKIGSGGMGVIFKAEDLSLNRTVALKILPEDSIPGEDRIRRFQQEVRAASLLNHPNIVSVFQADFDLGWPYMAMELIPGKTLRELIGSEQFQDSNVIIDLICQVASALAAAHEAGVVHRDIKPENIMVRDDGFVKVLDFGLAKLRQSAPSSGSTSAFNTRPGNLAGTIHYLSPEQVLGEPLGPRSDLFSLGVVAYELATGVRPFQGASDGAVMNAILNHAPATPASIRPSIHADLEGLILRLLQKDPALRFQTASNLRGYCKLLLNRSSRSPAPPMAGGKAGRRALIWGGLAAAAICAAFFVWHVMRAGNELMPNDHMQLIRLTDSGNASRPALSPDGKYVAYLSNDADGIGIYLMQVATHATIRTVATRHGRIPNLAFSADGAYLYFVEAEAQTEANGLFRVPLFGGEPTRVSALPNRYFALSHDGRFAAFLMRKDVKYYLQILDLSTGESRLLMERSGAEYFDGALAWSPDDSKLAIDVCAGRRCGFYSVDARSGESKLIGAQSLIGVAGLAWLPDGNHWLGLIEGGNGAPQLMLVDYPSGRTRRITNDLDSHTGVSLSADGKLLVTSVRRTSLHIFSAPWNGSELGDAVQFTSRQNGISEAGGGLKWATPNTIVASTPDADGWNLQLIGADGKSQQLTEGPYYNAEQTVCPDGRTVVFKSDRQVQLNLWKLDIATRKPSQVTASASIDSSPSCLADSKSILFVSTRGGRAAIWRVALDGSTPVMQFPMPTEDYTVSRDGKWIATFDTDWWTHPSNLEILDAGTGSIVRKVPVHVPGHAAGGALRWTPDGSGVLLPWVQAGVTNLWLQPVTGGGAHQITHFSSGFMNSFDFSPDGHRLAYTYGADTTDVLLMRDFVTGKDAN